MEIERRLDDEVGEGVWVTLAPILITDREIEPHTRRELMLLDTADELIATGHTETVVVLAQTAIEVMADWALRISMPEGAVDPLLNVIPDKTLRDRRTRAIWAALTGDVLADISSWSEYKGHVERRNRVVHTGFQPTEDDARASIRVCEELIGHLATVIGRLLGTMA